MELAGEWQISPSDDELRRSLTVGGIDTGGWDTGPVPGRWQDRPALLEHQGPVLFVRRFTLDVRGPGGHDRWWLELDRVMDQADVWLDGDYLGDTDGYFVRHRFDITDQVDNRDHHDLAIEVACSPGGPSGSRRKILGVYEGGTDLWPRGNPGGLHAAPTIVSSGPVRICSLRAICREAAPSRAVVALRATLDTSSRRTVRLATTLAGTEIVEEQPLAVGHNEIEWTTTVTNPDLWWPAGMGPQPLHDLVVQVETRSGEISDRATRRIGLRTVTLHKKVQLSVNGERVFLRGVNLAPPGTRPDEAPALWVADLEQAAALGANAVRPYGLVQPDEFYDHADRLGMIVWQDLPLVGPAGAGLRRAATAAARALVDRLGHHPSIALWCGHVGPAGEWMVAGRTRARTRLGTVASHELPTLAKSVLDRSVKHAFDAADGSRPVFGFTGVLPHLPRLDSSPSHLWLGWRGGSERDLPALARRIPAQVGLVAELGAQSIPAEPDFVDAARWPQLDLDELSQRYGMEVAAFQRYVPPVGHATLASWVEATQIHQAMVVRRQVEELRRRKYRPTGGVFVHYLRNAMPGVGASLIDAAGEAKAGLAGLAAAYAPLIVVADRLPVHVLPGQVVNTAVHVVSDLRHDLGDDAVVDVVLVWEGGEKRWRFAGSVPADSCTRVGVVRWTVPDIRGAVRLELGLDADGYLATNRYDTTVRRH